MLNVGVELVCLYAISNLRLHNNGEIVGGGSNKDVDLAAEVGTMLSGNNPFAPALNGIGREQCHHFAHYVWMRAHQVSQCYCRCVFILVDKAVWKIHHVCGWLGPNEKLGGIIPPFITGKSRIIRAPA
ncbi:MAG TPA: hypothetical protein VF345_04200 [Chthoniobacterales bacterium]